ncbi:MAG: hypothetical protein AAGF23_18800, partial [Acidobacteriota bacterium]
MTSRAARLGVIFFSMFFAVAGSLAAAEPPRQLSDLSRPIGAVSSGFSADGQWLLFTVDSTIRTRSELYIMPADGDGSDVVKLGDTLTGASEISDDNTRVVFSLADVGLVSVPVTGGAPTVLVPVESGLAARAVAITPGDLVIFSYLPPGATQSEYFSVPLGGGAVSQLSQLPNSNWRISGMVMVPDGTRIIYGAAIQRRTALYPAPTTGGNPVLISHPLQGSQQINAFAVTPDGARVIYRVGTFINDRILADDLYSVAADGGSPAVLVHDGYSVGTGQVSGGTWGADQFFFTADDKLFFADSNASVSDLYLSEFDGSGKVSLGSEPVIAEYWWRPQDGVLF